MKAARIAYSIAALFLIINVSQGLDVRAQAQLDLSVDDVLREIFSRDGGDGLGGPNRMALGDFNDDGRLDILLGAPGGDGPNDLRRESGEVYIIWGSSSFDPEANIDELQDQNVTIFGRDPGDNYGAGVAAGDVNGDGFDDIIIGAPGGKGFNNSRTDVGEVAVVYGGKNLPRTIDLNETPPDVIVYGRIQNTDFGASLGAADLNANGVPDIVIGDRLAGGRGNSKPRSGSIYIIFGRTDLPRRIEIDSQNDSEDVRIVGAESDDQMGTSFGFGDVNSDGIVDIVMGAPLADGPRDTRPDGGEVYVLLGRREFPEEIDLGITTADITLFGANAQDQLGTSVTAGDVNGDGIADIVAGAPFSGGPEDLRGFSGEVIVIYGETFLQTVFDVGTDEVDVIIYGQEPLENLGSAVEVADLNSDGTFDLMLGASGGRGPDGTRTRAGKVYAIASSATLPSVIDLSVDAPNLIVYGEETGDELGSGLLGGDISGTGSGFILMGAVGADSPADGPDAGAVYVLPAREFLPPGGGPGGDGCPPNFPLGDVDNDCVVTIIDAKLICESVLGLRVLTETQIELADVAAPFGEITLADAVRVAEAAVGLITLQPVETNDPSTQQNTQNSVEQRTESLNVENWAVSVRNGRVHVRAQGTGISNVQLEVYNLHGDYVFNSGWSSGTQTIWNTNIATNRPANGVYLYILKARGAEGQVVTSAIKKIAILRQ